MNKNILNRKLFFYLKLKLYFIIYFFFIYFLLDWKINNFQIIKLTLKRIQIKNCAKNQNKILLSSLEIIIFY
jgi:hypothetical protein